MSFLPDSVSEKQRDFMQELAEKIDSTLNPGGGEPVNGFILITHPFNDQDNRCNHISNIRREDAVVLMTELLSRWKGFPEEISTRRQ